MRMWAMLVAVVALQAGGAGAAELRGFDAGSLAEIRQSYAGKPFVLAFWSVHCEPCRAEMADWKVLRRRHPGIPVLLVAADAPGERATILKFLARYDPGPVERWAFADAFQERIRYAVDRSWRGELPRTYYYDAAHAVTVTSGAIRRAEVEAWMARQSR